MVAYGLVASLLDYYVTFGMYLPSDPTNHFGGDPKVSDPVRAPVGTPMGP